MEKPDVDASDGLSPAISIDQKGTSRNPRSTVGTVTEVYDYLRLLFARVCHPHCVIGGREPVSMSQDYACPYDGISVPEPEPRNFSFNTPHGACPTCTGLGTQLVPDPDLLIPDPGFTLRQGAIAPWTRSQLFYPEMLLAVCESAGIDMEVPVRALPQQQLDLLLNGSGRQKIRFRYRNQYGMRRHYEAPFEGVLANVQRRYDETESDFVKQELEKYMSERPCPACGGARLKPESLAVTVADRNIAGVTSLSVTDAMEFFERLDLSERERTIARGILKEIRERLQFMVDVGLDYLTLERPATTLSGGESQRIRLATQIGSKLMGCLYILDEPSIGLHQRDNHRLIDTLIQLRDLGNTLIVVEHDEETIRSADWMVDIGPGAGEHGGHVVAAGPVP